MHLTPTVSHLITFICTVGGLIGTLSYFRAWLKRVHEKTVQATAVALVGEIGERTRQLVPNGGSSMRDDVTAIRNEQGELRRTVAAQGAQITALVEVVHAVNGRLDDMHSTKGGS